MKKKRNLRYCNVLEAGLNARHLWQFNFDDKITLAADQKIPGDQPLPPKAVHKDWRTLWQQKLNIAWIPSEYVFLRVVHLPPADPAELLSMVDLQLEKLSPLPVNQIVWSFEPLPHAADNLQPVLVIIVARAVIEQHLGKLETDGYLPDRLEIPHLHQLLATRPSENAVQVYPTQEGDQTLCSIAWWTGGLLRDIELLHLPKGPKRGEVLVEQMTKTAWAGEIEGWFQSPIACHLIANDPDALACETALSQWSGQPVRIIEPLTQQALAEISAARAARESATANLLPPEFAAKYQQQFVDRLWMSGLAAITIAYIAGVLVYFAFLQVFAFQKNRVEKQVLALSTSYTNAVKLKARTEVLETQLNLKYAALDCLRVASENLPGELNLLNFTFSRGQSLRLEGTAPTGQTEPLYEYNSRLREAVVHGEPLFRRVDQPQYQTTAGQIRWNFTCELARGQTE